MRILFVVAMEKEYTRACRLLGGKSEGNIYGHQISLMTSGIGKVNAAVALVEKIASWKPDCVISTGVAGSLSDSVDVMDVVVADELVYHDVWCGDDLPYGQIQGMPERFRCDGTLRKAALRMDVDFCVRSGLVCSGDRFVVGKDYEGIVGNFPDALAVDMESAALAQVCFIKGLPFLSLRIISDSVKASGDNMSQYRDFWDRLADRSFDVLNAFLNVLE